MKKSRRVVSRETESDSTPVTTAERGPAHNQVTNESTWSLFPWANTSTEPSGRFRTHPSTPRDLATWRQVCRNPTPWTRPVTRARIALSVKAEPGNGGKNGWI